MDEFTVKRATLYQSGIGWFAAEGEISGDTIFFPVASKSLDDFLKTSLINIKDSKAAIRNISFETKGLENNLFATDEVLIGIINFLKGSDVVVIYDGNVEYSGKVLGYQIFGEKEPGYILALLTESGKILHLDAMNIREITPISEKNKVQLQEFTTSLASESDEEQQTLLKIQLNDTGDYIVVVSFLTDIPAWKLAYRFIINSEKISLNTYGIIDNNTLVDWKDAIITLSTKTPVSFQYDLSTPHIISRQRIERETDTGISVPELDAMPAPPPQMKARRIMVDRDIYEEKEFLGGINDYEPEFEEQSEIEAGESIEYHLIEPVTIRRKQSSMVPLAQASISGEQKLYYNAANHNRYPFYVVEFENTLGYAIESGPISVYEGSKFVGEGMLSRIGKQEKYLLSYALDKNVTVIPDSTSMSFKEGVHIKKLAKIETYTQIDELVFEITNKSDEPAKLYLAVSKRNDYEPLKGEMHEFIQVQKYIEAPNEYRVIANCAAHTSQTIKFYMVREYDSTYYLYNLSIKELEELLKQKSLSDKERKIILAMFNITKEVEEHQIEKDSVKQKYDRQVTRRDQIIQTLEVLDKTEEKARSKYIAEIEKIDTVIAEYSQQIEDLEQKIKELIRKSKNYNQVNNQLKK